MAIANYVDPNIGGIGHLLTATVPLVSLPHGMMKIAPITTPGIKDRYLADRIFGFTCGGISIMPTAKPGVEHVSGLSSQYDHDLETAKPYEYSVLLEDEDIFAEATVAHQSGYYRFSFPDNGLPGLVLSMLKGGSMEVVSIDTIKAVVELSGVRHYTYLRLSCPASAWEYWEEEGKSGVMLTLVKQDSVEVQAGISYLSAEQALANLTKDNEGKSYESMRSFAFERWNDALGRVEIKGGSEEQRTVFYTALYRSQLNMSNITEDGYYYSGYDHQVYKSGNHDFYVHDNIWDTYRSLHPLQLLLDPARKRDMIHSYLRMYEQCGFLPQFPSIRGDLPMMTGNHTAAMILDAYRKGCREFDHELAYRAMKKNAMEWTMLPWVNGSLTELDRIYLDKGFFPALDKGQSEWVKEVDAFERRQAVAVTLEHAYDDWCVAQMALILGYQDDYAYFMKRAQNYRNLFDERIGFMAPKTADGNWVEEFDPKLGGGLGGRDYFSECNSWIYTFHVQHDIEGLMELIGGKRTFEKKLDDLFTEQYDGPKYAFLGQFPDATGLIGQYCQGNEPAFHIPYLYNYAGAPWKTQRKTREIMKLWYQATPAGICGDEDNGAMSSWYVFSAMGLYPVCPGKPEYEIGSPLFEEVKLHLGNGSTFLIRANEASDRNKYIQSAKLNGQVWNSSRIEHRLLEHGGVLEFEMGSRPNKNWGIERS